MAIGDLLKNVMFVQVPTTVMAAVDASVGIKTAVNFENRKNKLGTYCPPLAVFIDRYISHLHAEYCCKCIWKNVLPLSLGCLCSN